MGATAPQLKYAKNLIAGRVIPDPLPADIAAAITRIKAGEYVSGFTCSRVIDRLKEQPRTGQQDAPRKQQRRAAMVKPGCFIMAGHIWVAFERRDKLGVWVAQLVECAERIRDDDGERVNFELRYDRETSFRVLEDLTEAHRMTFAQARDYVVRYRRCIAPAGRSICGARLKAADSVELAIGPVCGQKFPGYAEALEKLRADRKADLWAAARAELGIALSNVELYRIAGPNVSTVAGVSRKLETTAA